MRLRFNDRDGQLYLTGLKGWQTNAGQMGGFDRIRYTGKPVDFPVGIEAKKTGLVVRFSTPLEAAAAADPQNYSLRGSDIRWSLNYGSQEYLLGQRELEAGKQQKGWTTLKVTGARLLDDGKSVALAIDGMVPAHQMELNISVKTVEGRPIKTKVNHTVHELR